MGLERGLRGPIWLQARAGFTKGEGQRAVSHLDWEQARQGGHVKNWRGSAALTHSFLEPLPQPPPGCKLPMCIPQMSSKEGPGRLPALFTGAGPG